MQSLSQCYRSIMIGTSLHIPLVADHEFVINPNLLQTGREIIDTILRNIDVALSDGSIIIGTAQGSSIILLLNLHLLQALDVCTLPGSISPFQLVNLQIVALNALHLQPRFCVLHLNSRSISLLLNINGSDTAHLA